MAGLYDFAADKGYGLRGVGWVYVFDNQCIMRYVRCPRLLGKV